MAAALNIFVRAFVTIKNGADVRWLTGKVFSRMPDANGKGITVRDIEGTQRSESV
ncbi:MAG: hypothetical protein R6W76_22415 [Caldilinea sp.]